VEITQIPFVVKVGIVKNHQGLLELNVDESVQNHLQTIHASALFTLAESASGEALQRHFPELVDKVVPVVRESQVKFKKPATSRVTAYPELAEAIVAKFREQFSRKGRSSIEVEVEVKDTEGNLVCAGTFNWYVQAIV
jgi:acyl-coenzyme A thioesterase PaaI-like protein